MSNVLTNIIRRIFGDKTKDDVIHPNDASDNNENKHCLDFDLMETKEFVHLESAYQNQEFVFQFLIFPRLFLVLVASAEYHVPPIYICAHTCPVTRPLEKVHPCA